MKTNIKTLNQLAISYRDSALNAINPGVPYKQYKTGTSKAYKTGNLYNKVAQANNQQTMVKPFGEEGFQIILNVAPNGAEYGQYVHYGTRKMGKRPFGQLGTENEEFQQLFEKLMNEKLEDKVDEYIDVVDEQFEKSGFKVS